MKGRIDMRNQSELVQLLDRYRIGQAKRLVIGLSIEDGFRRVQGTLMLAEGRGKWLRPRWFEHDTIELPEAIGNACRSAHERCGDIGAAEFLQVRSDLTRQLPELMTRLTRLSGKAAKRLLVACVDDPGLWPTDFDGQRAYSCFCEAGLLAEISGLTIVDSLPERDLASGGKGEPLFPLAYWLLFADRSEPIAETSRVVIESGKPAKVTWLPPSDGLDKEMPGILYREVPIDQIQLQLAEMRGQGSKEELPTNEEGEAKLELVMNDIEMPEQSGQAKWCNADPPGEIWNAEPYGCDLRYLRSMAVAMLGLMHVDQMPANLPWLTGAEYPRILGRLTPGRPGNWRQVIMDMADYHPPAMKLREAV